MSHGRLPREALSLLFEIQHSRIDIDAIRVRLGSVSSRECLDAPAILATFTGGRTGLVIV